MNTASDALVEAQAGAYTALADRIWGYAELGYEEQQSCAAHIDALERQGFRVQRGVAGIPTAFIAEAGSGAPIIGILGEYDALSDMSQESLALAPCPSSETATRHGHGCGHHLLGTAAHLAALAVKEQLEKTGAPGTVRFYGCPAEEGGFGKTYMVRAGLFDDVDAALTWHAGCVNAIMNTPFLSVIQAYFRFSGVAAHAGGSPHLGRSALDALELMNIGVNFLREHMPSDARVHYAITDAGGLAPNVVQARAEALYMMRAPDNAGVKDLYRRVGDIAKGAALMSGCQVDIRFHSGCSNVLLNTPLNQRLVEHMQRLGVPDYDAHDLRLAQEMQNTVNPAEYDYANTWLSTPWRDPKPLFDHIDPYQPQAPLLQHGSTDVGDVSWVTPTAQCMVACYAFPTSPHSWQWVAQGKSGIAHKGMLLAAKTLAATAMDLLQDAALRAAVRQDWQARRAGIVYECPIPADVQPPPLRTA